jgi:predicted phage baseplate assembly protein
MTTHSDCGCCGGIDQTNTTTNRPGLRELSYRVGTHASFMEAMQARLSSSAYPALAALKTRTLDDPTMALLDAWALVADVLGFYNERHVNEGYLRTATLRRSVVEMAQLVGYSPRPGVSASTFLAYTLDDNAKEETLIPKGARAQSIPGPGELPQSFETSDELNARKAWNNLKPRMTKPHKLSLDNILLEDKIYLAGTALNLKTNDHLLFIFGDEDNEQVVRRIRTAVPLFSENKTEVTFQSALPETDSTNLMKFVIGWVTGLSQDLSSKLASGYFDATDATIAARVIKNLDDHAQSFLLDIPQTSEFSNIFSGVNTGGSSDGKLAELLQDAVKKLLAGIKKATKPAVPSTTSIDEITSPLLMPASVQVRNHLHLAKDAKDVFKKGADAAPQLLVNLTPALAPHLYEAWANANVNKATPSLEAIYVLRVTAPLFGYNALPPTERIENPQKDSPVKFISVPTGSDWVINEDVKDIYLDNSYEGITPGSYILIDTLKPSVIEKGKTEITRKLARVSTVNNGPRTAYSLSGKTTHLTVAKEWRTANETSFDILRHTVVRAQSERLQLADNQINKDIGALENKTRTKTIELAELYSGLQPGRWLIISGERTDIPGTSGIMHSELAMLANIEHNYDPTLPGDKTLSTITLAENLAYSYKRDSVKIYGNVVKATNGEIRSETLGGGDASKSLQAFTLKQPPLTYVSASNPSGVDSTLQVYVNDVEWKEVDSLAGQSARARRFTIKTDEEGKTTVIFGNGTEGSRLPTGQENIKARYRNGIGKAGNVKENQISLLMSRPLGVKEVINPLPATGGADKETINQARRHAPLAVKALDRLVSVKDYEDFARMFGGIGKASAVELSDGLRRVVHITIAGEEDIPIDKNSDLYQNLYKALLISGDPFQPIQVDVRELMLIVISAGIKIHDDYLWEVVVTQVRNALLQEFSFEARELGQDVLLGEVIATIQSVPGVVYVDVDLLRGIPEKKIAENGERTLTTLDDISDIVLNTSTSGKDAATLSNSQLKDPQEKICVDLAGNDKGIYPAQLAFLTPSVTSSLILNQIF